LKQTTERADWLIGDRLLRSSLKGKALFSLAKPGNAYDDPVLGRDRQPAHMRKYVKTDADGGVYVNTGILNHAFYLMAMTLGGHSWERAGRVWYDTMRDKALKPKAQFRDFASLTHANATRLFGRTSVETRALKDAWAKVGLAVITGRL
jgi:Zn-dependent metalloprotease